MSFAARRLGLDSIAQFSLVAATATYTIKSTYTDIGFATGSSGEGTLAGAGFGSVTPAAFNGATILELLWGPATGTTATVQLQLNGVLPANFVTSVTKNGVSLGTVTQTAAGSGSSTWSVGGSVTSPFANGVTYTIGIS